MFQRADWMQYAECRGMDPELFHPTRGEVSAHIKAVCHSCPVIVQCRQMALADHTLQGVWGGLSERQRREQRRIVAARRARATAAFESLRTG